MGISLRSLLIVPFILPAIGMAALVGYSTHRSGQQAIESLTHQLVEETCTQIIEHLTTQLSTLKAVTESNAALIEQGILDIKNPSAIQTYFHQQRQQFPLLSSVELVPATNAPISIAPASPAVPPARLDSIRPRVLPASPSKTSANGTGVSGDWSLQVRTPENRDRPVVYLAYTLPLYLENGQFQGVLETTTSLMETGRLLAELSPHPSQQIFLIEPSGLLVTLSTGEHPFVEPALDTAEVASSQPQRLPAIQSQNAVTQAAMETLLATQPSLETLTAAQVNHFSLGSERYVVWAAPVPAAFNWLMVAAAPESTFAVEIQADRRQTLLLCGLMLMGSVWFGLRLSRTITRPIAELQAASQRFIRGTQPQFSPTQIREVATLQRSFQEMVAQFNVTFEAMEASERKLSNFLESLPIGVSVYTEGQFIFTNRKGGEILTPQIAHTTVGTPLPELDDLNTTLPFYLAGSRQRYPPERLPWVRGLRGETVYVDDLEVETAQRRVPLEVHTKPIFDDAGQVTCAINAFRDITTRRRAEQAQATFNESTDALFLLDVTTLHIVDCNQQAVELFEATSAQDLIDINGDRLLLYPSTVQAIQQFQLILLEKGFHQLEVEHITLKGNPFWGRLSAKPIRVADQTFYLIKIADISDRKQAEAALEDSRAKFQRLVDDIGDKFVVFSHTGADGVVTYVSGGFQAVFGLSTQDILDKSWNQIIQWLPADQETAQCKVRQLIEDAVEYQQFEMQFVHPRGDLRTILVSQHPARDTAGNLVAVEGILEDVTTRKRNEQELIQAKEIAENANRAKSAFIANVSHELRSPLNAILGFAELLQAETNLTRSQRDNAGLIYRSGQHLLTIINQVLDLAKVEANQKALDLEPVNLQLLLEDLRSLFTLKAEEKGLEFLIQRDQTVPTHLYTDKVKLRQILINLLDNAFKFTLKGKIKLTVTAADDASDRSTDDTLPPNPRRLKFEVADSGAGIAPEELPLLFEPFSQGQAGQIRGQGTGLGLNISREYVHLMGGNITVQSQLGQGSTFQFEIVTEVIQRKLSHALPALRSVVGLAPGQPRYRLLIVDDNPDNRRLLRNILSVLAVDLQEAENGQDAIARWQHWHPHLIWMDLRMPYMDGLEATRRIRALEATRPPATPAPGPTDWGEPKIIAVSATITENLTTLALQAGCDDFISKPFKQADIFEVLQQQLGVLYLYADAMPPPQPDTQNLADRKTEIAQLPSDLLQTLKEALVLGEPNQLEQAVTQVKDENPGLYAAIAAKVHNFDYQAVLALIRQVEA